MNSFTNERIAATAASPNLENYEQARGQFRWEEVEREFTWHETGKINMAYEAVDRHAESSRRDKSPCTTATGREKRRTPSGK